MRKLADAIEDSVRAGPAARRPFHPSALRGFGAATASKASPISTTTTAVKLASLMDHAPGQRQFAELEAYAYLLQAQAEAVATRRSSDFCDRRIGAVGAQFAAPTARRSRPPATSAASCSPATTTRRPRMSTRRSSRASASPNSRPPPRRRAPRKQAGLGVLMGAPNVVRGGSHSGNVSARDAGRATGCSTSCRPTTSRSA